MREIIKRRILKNPREENGDLGYIRCDWCTCQSGAYALFSGSRICKACLCEAIESIDDAILDFWE